MIVGNYRLKLNPWFREQYSPREFQDYRVPPGLSRYRNVKPNTLYPLHGSNPNVLDTMMQGILWEVIKY